MNSLYWLQFVWARIAGYRIFVCLFLCNCTIFVATVGDRFLCNWSHNLNCNPGKIFPCAMINIDLLCCYICSIGTQPDSYTPCSLNCIFKWSFYILTIYAVQWSPYIKSRCNDADCIWVMMWSVLYQCYNTFAETSWICVSLLFVCESHIHILVAYYHWNSVYLKSIALQMKRSFEGRRERIMICVRCINMWGVSLTYVSESEYICCLVA